MKCVYQGNLCKVCMPVFSRSMVAYQTALLITYHLGKGKHPEGEKKGLSLQSNQHTYFAQISLVNTLYYRETPLLVWCSIFCKSSRCHHQNALTIIPTNGAYSHRNRSDSRSGLHFENRALLLSKCMVRSGNLDILTRSKVWCVGMDRNR